MHGTHRERRMMQELGHQSVAGESGGLQPGSGVVDERHGLLFLVGLPRSGTKLLRDLLNRHRQISMPPVEAVWIPRLRAEIGSGSHSMTSEDLARFDRIVASSVYRLTSQRCSVPIPSVSVDLPAGTTLGACLEWFLRKTLDACHRPNVIVGDKSPSHVAHLGALNELDPSMRVIHIIRDPRDQVRSARLAWGKDPIRGAVRWKRCVILAEQWGKRHTEQYHRVCYEDLCADPEASLRRILTFLNLPFDDVVLSLEKPSENLGDTQGRTEIVRGNSGKWRETFSSRTTSRIEEIAAPVARSVGYDIDGEGRDPSGLETRWRQVMDAFSFLRFNIRYHGPIRGVREWRSAIRDRMANV
ncbi:MAG: sulfotransferase [Planctomycetes bacterium]|nr:sulfotransferase [Planctomycetota bacterium]